VSELRSPCPKCGRGLRDRTLATNAESRVFFCHRCGYRGREGGVARVPLTSRRIITRLDDPVVAQRKRARIERVSSSSVSLDHRSAWPVRRYLEARGLGEVLKNPPAVLRAVTALEYWEGTRSLGCLPAMVAIMQSGAGEVVTLHTTYLRADGWAKAEVPEPKKIMSLPLAGATKGAAIRLYEPPGRVLGIAEGIESALSLHLLQRIPVWASYCADNLVRVQLPRTLKTLYIGVDLDEHGKGEKVAYTLALRVTRWASEPEVWIVKPHGEAPRDLNDEIRTRSA